jgi:hypothetical protein
MSFTGTVVNGTVVFDGPAMPPEGSRVDVLLSDDDIGPPPEAFPQGDTLDLIREGLESIEAGRVRPYREVMDDIRKKFDLPDVPMEEA